MVNSAITAIAIASDGQTERRNSQPGWCGCQVRRAEPAPSGAISGSIAAIAAAPGSASFRSVTGKGSATVSRNA